MSGVVADASPLIALQQIGQLGLLGTIFVREPIDILRHGGFRAATDLYEDILRKAGELA